MNTYLTFKIDDKVVGVKYSNQYVLEKTHINKSFSKDNEDEYINYKRDKIRVYDVGELLFNKPMKKFDGLVFVFSGENKIALKTEGFFNEENVECDVVLDVEKLF